MFELDNEKMTENEKLNRNILIVYFVSYSGNKFIETVKTYYPK